MVSSFEQITSYLSAKLGVLSGVSWAAGSTDKCCAFFNSLLKAQRLAATKIEFVAFEKAA
jgi:hypothetical protein